MCFNFRKKLPKRRRTRERKDHMKYFKKDSSDKNEEEDGDITAAK